MADNYAICLLGAMDHLWFNQVILFSQSYKTITTLKQQLDVSESLEYSSSSNNSETPEEENLSLAVDEISRTLQDYESNKQNREKEATTATERSTRLNSQASKTRSHSSSPSTKKRPKHLRYAGAAMRLQKTMSCKSLCELELEEVKGFMDLGFKFSKEHLSTRMMSVIPGLQRLDLSSKTEEKNNIVSDDNTDEVNSVDDEIEEEEHGEKRPIIRPYLSEAWLIKRPDSPLLNLRIPRVSTAADMKKHLKYWARTVASAIQQES